MILAALRLPVAVSCLMQLLSCRGGRCLLPQVSGDLAAAVYC